MALFRKFFHKKPADGLVEIADRIFVFDCCCSVDEWEGDRYNTNIRNTVLQLKGQLPDAGLIVFNFREGERQSPLTEILSECDVTNIDYPRHYEGCPLLPMKIIHSILRSSESWLSLGQKNIILMHCERGGWPVLAFMLAAVLIYQRLSTSEAKTLDMIYKQAPHKLLQLFSPLNPLPSQIRYLEYISRRNIVSEWPPVDRALILDCLILRKIPNIDGKGGFRPLFRIYGKDRLIADDQTPTRPLFSMSKRSNRVRLYKQADTEVVKIDFRCRIQGDVVLECINLDEGSEHEEMMFRAMFNTAFISSNILMLNRDDIDVLWDAKDWFPKDFGAEVLLSEVDEVISLSPMDLASGDHKGLPVEEFSEVQEIFSNMDSLDGNADAGFHVLQQLSLSNTPSKEHDTVSAQKMKNDAMSRSPIPDTTTEKFLSDEEARYRVQKPSTLLLESSRPLPSSPISNEKVLLASVATTTTNSASTVSRSPVLLSEQIDQSSPQPPPPPPPPSRPAVASPKVASFPLRPQPLPPPPSKASGVPTSQKSSVASGVPPPPPPPSRPALASHEVGPFAQRPQPPSPPPSKASGLPTSQKSSVASGVPPPPPPPSRPPLASPEVGPFAQRPPPPPPPPSKASRLPTSQKSSVASGVPHPPPPPSRPALASPRVASFPQRPPPPTPPPLKASSVTLGLSSGPEAIGAKGQDLESATSPRKSLVGHSPSRTVLKHLHWVKARATTGSLWAESQIRGETFEASEFDMSELENLFSAAEPSITEKPRRASFGSKSDIIHLIDLRRAHICELIFGSFKMPISDLLALVLALDDSMLETDRIEYLIKMCPTKQEMELLEGYNGDKEKLGICEQLFLQSMEVPRLESKLRVFLFKVQFHPQVADIKTSLNIVNSVATEVRNSVKLRKVMQTILSLGNALNQGTARGSAIGFKLDSLLKLSDLRSRNNKMTLLHYLSKVLADKLPEVLDFDKDITSLEAAAKIQLRPLAEEMQALSKGLEKVEQELTMSDNDGPVSQTFHKTLKEFLVQAEAEVRTLTSLYSRVGRNADALVYYFGEDPASCPFEQVVSTLHTFVKMFGRAHAENCKQLDLEKGKAQKEVVKMKLGTP